MKNLTTMSNLVQKVVTGTLSQNNKTQWNQSQS